MTTKKNAAQASASVSDELSLQDALNTADMYAQGVHRLADATLAAVRALLTGPDSITTRMSVIDLVAKLSEEAFTAMNGINAMAEQCGVNFKDDQWHACHGAVCAAFHADNKKGGAA